MTRALLILTVFVIVAIIAAILIQPSVWVMAPWVYATPIYQATGIFPISWVLGALWGGLAAAIATLATE